MSVEQIPTISTLSSPSSGQICGSGNSFKDILPGFANTAARHFAFIVDPSFKIFQDRITSYNVCYTKLLRYKNEKNLGIYGNWNRCLQLARGKWYTMLHDDDLLSNNFLKEMMGVLNKNPKISCLNRITSYNVCYTKLLR